MPLIEIIEVTKIYPLGHQEVTAVEKLSLGIEGGEFTVLAGPSGSGKTTLLNLIGGLDKPTTGRLAVAGNDITSSSVKDLAEFRLHKVGFIFQSYNLIPVLTAEENAEFTLLLQGIPRNERHKRVRELFTLLGISGLENRRPNDLSGGQQQRVAIARAMATEPAVILADEPTANLDSKTASDLLEQLKELNREKGVTFILSSHDPLVISQARRVIRLRDGRLESDTEGNP